LHKGEDMLRTVKILLIALAIVAVAGGTYAFAAANTVPATAAGYSATTVSGYTVTNVVYDLNETDPRAVDAITFNVAPTTGSVVAALVKIQTSDAGSWKDCTLVAGVPPSMSATCSYTSGGSLNLEDISALNVVASSSLDPAP
jgi:hypothetical protein